MHRHHFLQAPLARSRHIPPTAATNPNHRQARTNELPPHIRLLAWWGQHDHEVNRITLAKKKNHVQWRALRTTTSNADRSQSSRGRGRHQQQCQHLLANTVKVKWHYDLMIQQQDHLHQRPSPATMNPRARRHSSRAIMSSMQWYGLAPEYTQCKRMQATTSL